MKMFTRTILSAVVAISACFPLTAMSTNDCKSLNLVKEPCRWVSGELFEYNGWPPNTRIQITGTKQVFGVGPDPEEGLMPSYLADALDKSELTRVRGEFEICPFGNHYRNGDQTDDEPNLSDVCIQSGRNLAYLSPSRDPKALRWVEYPIPKTFHFVGLPPSK